MEILIVDDDPTTILVLVEMLRQLGAEAPPHPQARPPT